jgi:hypothetical protein
MTILETIQAGTTSNKATNNFSQVTGPASGLFFRAFGLFGEWFSGSPLKNLGHALKGDSSAWGAYEKQRMVFFSELPPCVQSRCIAIAKQAIEQSIDRFYAIISDPSTSKSRGHGKKTAGSEHGLVDRKLVLKDYFRRYKLMLLVDIDDARETVKQLSQRTPRPSESRYQRRHQSAGKEPKELVIYEFRAENPIAGSFARKALGEIIPLMISSRVLSDVLKLNNSVISSRDFMSLIARYPNPREMAESRELHNLIRFDNYLKESNPLIDKYDRATLIGKYAQKKNPIEHYENRIRAIQERVERKRTAALANQNLDRQDGNGNQPYSPPPKRRTIEHIDKTIAEALRSKLSDSPVTHRALSLHVRQIRKASVKNSVELADVIELINESGDPAEVVACILARSRSTAQNPKSSPFEDIKEVEFFFVAIRRYKDNGGSLNFTSVAKALETFGIIALPDNEGTWILSRTLTDGRTLKSAIPNKIRSGRLEFKTRPLLTVLSSLEVNPEEFIAKLTSEKPATIHLAR